MRVFLYIFGLMIAISTPAHILIAHGTGTTVEEEKDGYFIDIGYNAETVRAHEPVVFDFILNPASDENVADATFTDVWVRIVSEENDSVLFAGPIHNQRIGPTGFTYQFPDDGAYMVSARFQNDGAALTEKSFTVDVVDSEEGVSGFDTYAYAVAGVLGLFLGATLLYRISRKKTYVQK